MGYANYEITDGPLKGESGGYCVEAPCCYADCVTVIDRSIDALCGRDPHGGDEHGCGLFFCDAHIAGHFIMATGQYIGRLCLNCTVECPHDDPDDADACPMCEGWGRRPVGHY